LQSRKYIALQQAQYQEFCALVDDTLASPAEAAELLRYCARTLDDALARLSTPSESAASSSSDGSDGDGNALDLATPSPGDPYWLQQLVGEENAGTGLQASGKFWAQKAQLQALGRNVRGLEEHRRSLLAGAAEIALLKESACPSWSTLPCFIAATAHAGASHGTVRLSWPACPVRYQLRPSPSCAVHNNAQQHAS
jgi:hypothetical protein